MKHKAFMSLAAITLNIFAMAPGALAADADPFAAIRDATGKKDYDKVITIAESNLPDRKTPDECRVYDDLCMEATAARILKSAGLYEDALQITRTDHAHYKINKSLIWYQRYVMLRLHNSNDLLRRLCQDYAPQAKTNSSVMVNVYTIYRHTLNDLLAAYKIAAECEDWLKVADCLSSNTGKALTDDDAKALYQCIVKILEAPTISVNINTARVWAAKTVPGLFTTGKISKKEYVSVMKKMYMRFYLRIAEDQKAWEPVIAQIKFGINYADKLADVIE